MPLPRLKAAKLQIVPPRSRPARRFSDVTLDTPRPVSPDAWAGPRSLPTAMYATLPEARPQLSPAHPAMVAHNTRALTETFDRAPEALDRDPSTYRSPLSGNLLAYQQLNARLLQGVAQQPRIQGFGFWLHDMCTARVKSPKTERPAAENLVRRLFELIEALYLCQETSDEWLIDVSCDQSKGRDNPHRMPRSSDLSIRNARDNRVRHMEVTSLGARVHQACDLERCLQHIADKVEDDGVGTHEGAIALKWADEALPETVLGDMLAALNNPTDRAPAWLNASSKLDRLVLLRYDPLHADPMAIFTKQDGRWYASLGPFPKLNDILPPLAANADAVREPLAW